MLVMNNQTLEDKAKGCALRFLSYRARTTTEVQSHLTNKGFEESIQEKVIEYLKDYRYLDDKSYAETLVRDRFNCKGYGRLRIAKELKEKRISSELASHALNQISTDDEYAKAWKLILKKLDRSSNRYSKQQLANILLRKGYNWEVVSKLLNSEEFRVKLGL